MLSVVCWKWGTLYPAEYVNRLQSMLSRHLHLPYTLFCITDDVTGIHPRIECVDMFADTFPGMVSPSGIRANFRRLKIFDGALSTVFGPRILQLDLDVVILDDVTTLFARSEPLVVYNQIHIDPNLKRYNPSMVLMDTGVLSHMWDAFVADPEAVWKVARGGANNTDQAVLGYFTKDVDVPCWTEADGVQPYYKIRNNDGAGVPAGTRMVLFFGDEKPGDVAEQHKCPWIQDHWR